MRQQLCSDAGDDVDLVVACYCNHEVCWQSLPQNVNVRTVALDDLYIQLTSPFTGFFIPLNERNVVMCV